MPILVVLRPFLPYIIGLLAILGVGYWIHYHGYRSGVDDTVAAYEVKIQAERTRLQAANAAALKAAKEVEEQLRTQLSARNEKIRILTIESMSSPDAADQCLGSDWVRRLNDIR